MKNKKDKKEEGVGTEEDFKEKYLRALADYQNLLKRTVKEKEDFLKFVNEGLIKKLLPVLDNLEKAENVLKDKGIELIHKELLGVLTNEGLERIIIKKDEAFDPGRMECIAVEEGGKKLEEVRAGYTLNKKVIRVAQVKVVK